MSVENAPVAEPSPLDTDEIPVVAVTARRRPAWRRTWALGTVALALAVFLGASGLGLLFFYRPVVGSAYLDLVDLSEASRFAFVRELHRWGSHALLIVVALHLLRTVVTGDYHPPKRFNYQLGVVLGLVALFSALTGYLLPWDRHAQWLMQLLSEQGITVDAAALNVAFAFHCGVLPAVGTLLLVVHLRRARRAHRALKER